MANISLSIKPYYGLTLGKAGVSFVLTRSWALESNLCLTKRFLVTNSHVSENNDLDKDSPLYLRVLTEVQLQ